MIASTFESGDVDKKGGEEDGRAALRLLLKLFLGSLGVLQAIEGVKAGLKGRSRRAGALILRVLRSILSIRSTNLRASTFVSLYPILFRAISKLFPSATLPRKAKQEEDSEQQEIFPSSFRPLLRLQRSKVFRGLLNPALLVGPLAYLLPPSILGQLDLYAVSVLGLALVRWTDKHVLEPATREASSGSASPSEDPASLPALTRSSELKISLKRILQTAYKLLSSGGGWWLFALTQGFLLHVAIFEPRAFSRSYRNAIIGRSGGYLPTERSIRSLRRRPRGETYTTSHIPTIPTQTDLLHLVPRFTRTPSPHPSFPPSSTLTNRYLPFAPLYSLVLPSASSKVTGRTTRVIHDKLFCATYHPTEPSCLVNFVKAAARAMPSAVGFVGGWGALSLLLFGRKRARIDPLGTLRKWIVSTARGSAFMTLAAWICAFQRILRPDQLTRLRFALGGILAGLWILLVPSARRLELGMYCLRLSMTGVWKVGVLKGWWRYHRTRSVLAFTLAMAALTGFNHEDVSLTHGWVARLLVWLDQRPH